AEVGIRRSQLAGVQTCALPICGENLLRPSRDAGVVYLRRLEAGLKPDGTPAPRPPSPATLQVKLAAARTLYRALRWAGATEARPDRTSVVEGMSDHEGGGRLPA